MSEIFTGQMVPAKDLGTFPHHHDCMVEFQGQTDELRRYWCDTHGQWVYEYPKVIHQWSNGDTTEVIKR